MAQPYVGEIRLFAGNFAPAGWAMCQGQQLPISENETLFTLIGTTYGGDGEQYFNLPDLQGRVPVHMGQGSGISQAYNMGDKAGVETVTLSATQIPVHTHSVLSCSTGQVTSPQNAFFADAGSTQGGLRIYSNLAPTASMNAASALVSGGSQPHSNIQPTLCLSYIISLYGIYPSPT